MSSETDLQTTIFNALNARACKNELSILTFSEPTAAKERRCVICSSFILSSKNSA